jgi:hypothetical protein
MFRRHVVTLDVDWAPDEVIDEVAHTLLIAGVKATWFITHDSPAIKRLADHPELFEIGLHPNFNKGSSQGDTPESVMEYLKAIFPHSCLMRTHGLTQTSNLLTMAAGRFKIVTDVSIFLPYTPGIIPHELYFPDRTSCLVRVPYFWEDDFEFYQPDPCWSFADRRFHGKGLKVINFHPIHIALNSVNEIAYEKLKATNYTRTLSMSEIKPYVNRGAGTRTFFLELVEYLSKKKEVQANISDIVQDWKETHK